MGTNCSRDSMREESALSGEGVVRTFKSTMTASVRRMLLWSVQWILGLTQERGEAMITPWTAGDVAFGSAAVVQTGPVGTLAAGWLARWPTARLAVRVCSPPEVRMTYSRSISGTSACNRPATCIRERVSVSASESATTSATTAFHSFRIASSPSTSILFFSIDSRSIHQP